jgi:hypothetical protein
MAKNPANPVRAAVSKMEASVGCSDFSIHPSKAL